MAKPCRSSAPGRVSLDRPTRQALGYQRFADRSAAAKGGAKRPAIVLAARCRLQGEWTGIQQGEQPSLRRLPPAFLLDAPWRTEIGRVYIGKPHFQAANPERVAIENAIE